MHGCGWVGFERRWLSPYADLAFSDVANDGASWNLSFCGDAPTPQSENAKVASPVTGTNLRPLANACRGGRDSTVLGSPCQRQSPRRRRYGAGQRHDARARRVRLKAEFFHVFALLFDLLQFGFPVLALAGVFVGEGRGVVLERDRLNFCRALHVEVVRVRPYPMSVPRGHRIGDFDVGMGQAPFAEPADEEPIENLIFDKGAFRPDGSEIGLMVELRRGVGVASRRSGYDGVGNAERRAEFRKNLLLEVGIGGDGCLDVKLVHLPPFRHGRETVHIEFHRVHRFDFRRLVVLRLVRVEDAAVASGLRGRFDHRARVAAQLGEERKCRDEFGDAAMLLRAVLAVDVHHVLGRNDQRVRKAAQRRFGMVAQDAVGTGVAVAVVDDAVHHDRLVERFTSERICRARRQRGEVVARHAVGVNQLEIEFHRAVECWVVRQHHERLAVGGAGDADRAELGREANHFRPRGEVAFDAGVEVIVVRTETEARARADGVVRDGLHHAAGVRVVLNLEARTHTERPPNVGVRVRIGGQVVRPPPVGRFRRGVGGDEVGADRVEERGAGRRGGFAAPEEAKRVFHNAAVLRVDGLGEREDEDRIGTVLWTHDVRDLIERQGVWRVEVNDIGVVEVASEIVADLHLLVVRFEEAKEHAADDEFAALFGWRVGDGDCHALIPDADHLSLFHVVVERELNLLLERFGSVDLVTVECLGLFHWQISPFEIE